MMRPIDTIRVALVALTRNKVRSFLTTLGVIIGVAAVISMLAIGQGARKQVEDTFSSMGSNLLILRSGSSRQGGAARGAGSGLSITWDDMAAIEEQVPLATKISPVLQSGGQAISDRFNWQTMVYGVSPDYLTIRNWSVIEGSSFDHQSVQSATATVLLGTTVRDELFGEGVDAIGGVIRINGTPFTVQGILAPKGQSPWGTDQDDAVLIPYTTYQRRIQAGLNQFIDGSLQVSTNQEEQLDTAMTQITELLRIRHRIRPGAPDDFTIRNLTEMANARQEGTKTFTTLLASIAAVSLLVGGIGIMNIMLVSVTERTREIGLRMAIGARPRDILLQFLIEALFLSLLGGFLGAMLGVGLALKLGDNFGWEIIIDPSITVVAVGFSAFVGIVFGLHPAMQASRLDPIDALRYE